MTGNDVLAKFGLQPRMTAVDYVLPALGVFGAGALMGAGLALMLTPKSGRELRGDITSAAGSLKRKVMLRGKPNGLALDELTREELYTRAQELDIEGRSDMSKSELLTAVQEAS